VLISRHGLRDCRVARESWQSPPRNWLEMNQWQSDCWRVISIHTCTNSTWIYSIRLRKTVCYCVVTIWRAQCHHESFVWSDSCWLCYDIVVCNGLSVMVTEEIEWNGNSSIAPLFGELAPRGARQVQLTILTGNTAYLLISTDTANRWSGLMIRHSDRRIVYAQISVWMNVKRLSVAAQSGLWSTLCLNVNGCNQ
jgi:hypothetical protein